jgi:hypothetical protein
MMTNDEMEFYLMLHDWTHWFHPSVPLVWKKGSDNHAPKTIPQAFEIETRPYSN